MSDSHYFIGLPISSDTTDMIHKWQTDLKNELSYKQWTHPKDFHITLKFLGAVNEQKLKGLLDKLEDIKRLQAIALELKGVKYFGNPKSPRVLYANVQNQDNLTELFEKVESCTEKVGYKKETREFRPHITLAKKWKHQSHQVEIDEFTGKYANEVHSFDVDQVNVYQIHPHENPKYEVIKSYKLKGRGT